MIEFKRLQLIIEPGNWQKYNIRKNDAAFQQFREKVLQRDSFICQFCGFQAKQYQEVINLDNNYSNNKLSNMATSCVFCAQCHFLESIGVGNFGGASLIYLPEIPQSELNALCHVLFCAIANGTNYKDTSLQIYRGLKFRSQSVEDYFGSGASKPSVFGRLILSSLNDPQGLKDVLANLRLLPSHSRFKEQIDAWARAALEELPAE